MRIIKDIERVDIGCGKPSQKYKGCFGIDLNPEYKPDLLHNCDDGFPFPNNSLKFVNSDNSLEHFRNPFFVLKECHRALKKGGKMRLVVPNCQYFPLIFINMVMDLNWFWHWYMNLPFKKGRSYHFTLYTKHLIKMVATDIGFRIKEEKGWLYSKEITLILEK
jgi:predicted SAM-dependent methyltransferase